ncbi:carbon-nitrogen family hydrolase [Thermoactinomyces sp. CICC 10523]|uniref:carbon-nitrogen family hydrolase n=1 Tax=Thermoactinomyces sp. CICC 10523 TaxID=2767428 RepID=UPI0018DEA5B6|nr:carbon-nitrogen family hydrolase [Thermoactinomyces sp. CICC 10523]MBH8597327.1 carbon-nitrogen family hydrolase [Thermoactinomyces sp. CICC 10523]
MRLQLALIQMDISFGNPEANWQKVIQKIGEAASHKADIIVLPELWNTGYDLSRLDEIADPDGTETKTLLQDLSKKHQVHIVAGSVAKKTASGFYNTLYAFDKQGIQAGEYSKAHLFGLMEEDRYLQAGSRPGLFTLGDLPCAGVICYDIRFPEWTRTAALSGAELLFVPAEWPQARLDHWRQLLLTRAIENQWFVIACNRAGSDPNNVFAGHSLVIDPWGKIIAEAGSEETILYAEIDPEQVAEVRSRIPIFSDRRPELYTKE